MFLPGVRNGGDIGETTIRGIMLQLAEIPVAGLENRQEGGLLMRFTLPA